MSLGGRGGVIGVIIALMVSMLIGLIVINALISSVSQSGWSQKANETWSNLQSNIWVAYGLLVIIPIIIGAVIIMRYIGRGM